MDIFINGEKINIGVKNGKLINVLEKIEAKVIKHGEVIVELKLDGEMFDGKALPLNKKVKVLELTTRSHREILIESLYLLEPYLAKLYVVLNEIEENPEDLGKLFEIISFIEWTLGIVFSLKEATAIDLIYSDYDEYLTEFKKYSDDMFDAFRKEEYGEMLEILDAALIPLIEDLAANSKEYLKEVMKEEKRKDLVN